MRSRHERSERQVDKSTYVLPKGSSAPRAYKGYPQSSCTTLVKIFELRCVQTSTALRPCVSTCGSAAKGGRFLSPCTCYPPPSPGDVRHVCHMPLPKRQM